MTSKTQADCELMAQRLLHQHGLSDWRIDFQNLSHGYMAVTNGQVHGNPSGDIDAVCDRFQKLIVVNWWGFRKRKFRQIMLHEIAHALRGGALRKTMGHDQEWAQIALRIGCTRLQVAETMMECAPTKAERVHWNDVWWDLIDPY